MGLIGTQMPSITDNQGQSPEALKLILYSYTGKSSSHIKHVRADDSNKLQFYMTPQQSGGSLLSLHALTKTLSPFLLDQDSLLTLPKHKHSGLLFGPFLIFLLFPS